MIRVRLHGAAGIPSRGFELSPERRNHSVGGVGVDGAQFGCSEPVPSHPAAEETGVRIKQAHVEGVRPSPARGVLDKCRPADSYAALTRLSQASGSRNSSRVGTRPRSFHTRLRVSVPSMAFTTCAMN